jgi:hypothetical protein
MENPALDCILATKGPIGLLGSKFMFHPKTVAMGAELGFPNGFAMYFAGRGGVLGDGDADVVLASWGFFEPSLVRKMWDAGTAAVPARRAGTFYAEAAAQWGRDHLSAVKGLPTFNKLATKLVASADVQGLPLFAGWRAEPLPPVDDAAGRAGQLLHVLREHRGSVHLLAVIASGLTPLEAHVTKRGIDGAKLFGWTDPAELPKPRPAAHKKAEALTDKLCVPTYAELTDRELVQFAKSVTTIGKAVKD